jgi:hypothetical protein
MTKTAGRENQKRCLNESASPDHGTEGTTILLKPAGLDGKTKSGRRKAVFS